ncbi:hypothetical protein ACFV2D_03555 [Streptomyces capillispiralis]|uniref:hypothetical protein n=1 Tax=Streptomyces capillispiralis TaxID=68182 RepID=UPI0036832D65
MSNPSTRVRGAGAPARRTLAAAARAAAKRTERTEGGERTGGAERTGGTERTGRTAVPTRRPERTEPARRTGTDGDGSPADGPPADPLSGRTVVIEPPDGWDDPPEPSPAPDKDEPRAEDPAEPAGSPARRPGQGVRPRRGLYAALLALLLVAGLVAVAVLGLHYRDARRTEAARDGALAAAREAAPVVLSYDHRHLDRDFSRALAQLTGDFREEYRRTTKTVVAPTAAKYRGTVKATVVAPPGGAPAASVVSAAPDRVVVLLFVNQVTESTQVTGPRLDLNRVRMTLSRTSQGWKVSAVDAL